jgi:hypothetical protein
MKNKLWDNNYRNKELVFHNEMDYEIQKEEFVIQKSKVGTSMVSTNSIDLLA